jgi:hypothetical protein
MAFLLPYTVGCDHLFHDGQECQTEATVKARSHEEAASLLRVDRWLVKRVPYEPGEAKVGDPEKYQTYCPDHAWEHDFG